MKTYDAWIIFPTALKDEGLAKAVKDIENEITKLQGKITDTQRLGIRTFARPMQKQPAGNYVRMSFSMDPANLHGLQQRLKLVEAIFRLQIVQADPLRGTMPPAPGASENEKDKRNEKEERSNG